ncbi:MAG: hypothetical protein WC806_03260 [Candidatus Gracilibacteria bacterium]|jgi:hypothetical protein
MADDTQNSTTPNTTDAFKIEDETLHVASNPQAPAQPQPTIPVQEQQQEPTTQTIPQEQAQTITPIATTEPATPIQEPQIAPVAPIIQEQPTMPTPEPQTLIFQPAPKISKEQEIEESKKLEEMEKTMEIKLKETENKKTTNYISKKIIIGIAVIAIIGILSAGAYYIFNQPQNTQEQATIEQNTTPPQIVNPFDDINQIEDQANPIEDQTANINEPTTNETTAETPTEPSSLTPPSLTETPSETSTETPSTEPQKRPRSRTISE